MLSQNKLKITVVGAGYVGMSLACLLAQKCYVTVLDNNKNKIDLINSKKSTVSDKEIESFLKDNRISIKGTLDKKEAYTFSDFIIIATPTNFNIKTKTFDLSNVESVISNALAINAEATIIIKSTIPIGYTNELRKKFKTKKIIFSPEFLREGRALLDNLNPSRIVLGSKSKSAKKFANLLADCATKKDIPVLFLKPNEAESIKLFSNTYLALRVAFFNELDSYALENNLDSQSIIDAVCLDSRIGNYYNNPSFGYGGYCLPKDTKQLLSAFKNIPQSIIQAIVKSNSVRKQFIAEKILEKNCNKVGIYRLIMKEGSDNMRSSAILDIIKILIDKGIEIIIYEPNSDVDNLFGASITKDLEFFKQEVNLIVANRMHKEIRDFQGELFTRDLFGLN